MILRFFLACALYCFCLHCHGQAIDLVGIENENDLLNIPDSNNLVTVRSINIVGNKSTKIFIVQREVAVEKGDSYTKKELHRNLRQTREQLMNTSLFVDVIVTPVEVGDLVDVNIELKERWYVFPVPYFKVVERNWNVWVKEYGASMDRVNYGIKLTHSNATGLNDKFNFWAIGGYTQQLSYNYFRPYFDKKLRFGYSMGFSYARNREVNYATEYNKLLTIDTSYFNRKYLHAEAGLSYRQGSKLRMQAKLGYTDEKVDTIIAKLNPNYFGDGQSKAKYFDFTVATQYYNVDYIPYPLRGWYVEASALHRIPVQGDVKMFQLSGKFLGTWQFLPKTYIAFQAATVIRFPFRQPYYNSRLLGFGDVTMQGLEYYVADGGAGGMARATLRHKVLEFHVRNLFKGKSHNDISFRFFAKVYGNLGYVYNKTPGTSFINNRLLRTGGFGLDIVTIYDWVIKLDFSFNQFDSGGKLFLHTQSDF